MYFLSCSRKCLSAAPAARGFGLVELMVCISIMMILTTIILVRQSSFNGSVLLRSQAYEIAFTLRRAQLMAVSGNNSGGGASLAQEYGVYFDTATPNTYVMFHDLDADGKWDGGIVDKQIGPLGTIDKRFSIRGITNGAGTPLNPTNSGYNITFIRPNFDAHFSGDMIDNPVYIDIAQVNAGGTDTSAGAVRRVEVGATGQISVTSY